MQPNAARIVSYFREVKSELRKVHWPSRQETVYYTLTVIAVSVAAAVFLGGLDVLFAYLLNTFLL